MKKFKELLLLSNVSRLSMAKIYLDYIPALSRFRSFDKFSDFLKKDFGEDKIEKALEKTESVLSQLEEERFVEALTIFDRDYPANLKDMGNKAPLFLYAMGNTEVLNKPNLAITGTEKPDLISQNFEYKLTRKIVEETERVIVSGMSLGCDKIAHMTTVDIDEPTIAVLPSGINRIEPESNLRLAKGILQSEGCIISPFGFNTGASERSQIIKSEYVAAISQGVFAVQCARDSQTTKTVNFADKYGRKIACFAPKDEEGADFSGNKYVLNNYSAFKYEELEESYDDFIRYLKGELKLEASSPKSQIRDRQVTLDYFY